ncbi:M28 family peptidase [Gemmatimonadota bacterium]
MPRSSDNHGGRPVGLAAAFALLLFISYIGLIRYEPPPPQSAGSDPQLFSALRALPILENLVGDDIPHPVGSVQHAVVRNRIVAHLESFGYTPEVQHATIEMRQGPVTVSNVIARLDGTIDGPAVVLLSHYDSVPDGTGASDAGVCVAAILEIARLLKEPSPPLNDIIFLLTDAEEVGLVGAQAFVEAYDLPRNTVVVNLDARGTSGPSLMLETSADSGWLMDIYAREIERPATSSLFYEIYKRMPNDTDFTVFKQNGFEGYNFAFIGGGENYHTEHDTFENVTLASLQHHGENALSLVEFLGWNDLTERASGRHVYFDVFGTFVVKWPEPETMRYALLLVLLIILTLRKLLRMELIHSSGVAGACVLWIIIVAGGVLSGWGLNRLLILLGGITAPWMDGALYIVSAFWLLALVWAILVVPKLAPKLGVRTAWEMWLGVWLWWTILSLLLGMFAPGASYLVIVPAIVASTFGALGAYLALKQSPLSGRTTAVLSAAAAAVIWVPMEFLFYDALGFGANLFLAGRAAMIVAVLTPLMIRVQSTPPGRKKDDRQIKAR